MKKLLIVVCFLLLFVMPSDAASIEKIEITIPKSTEFTVGGWITLSNDIRKYVSGQIKITPSTAVNNELSVSSSKPRVLWAVPGKASGPGMKVLYIAPLSSGDVTLTIASGTYKATFPLRVISAKPGAIYVSDIIIYGPSNMTVGEEANLQYQITPDNVTNPELIWQSDTPEVAAVDEETGKITALQEGVAGIIAGSTDGSARSSNAFVVTVLPAGSMPASSDYVPAESLKVTGPSKMKVGETVQMQVQVTPGNATLKEGVSWYSSNPSVAMVDKNGQVTAYSQGQVIIGGKIYEHRNNTSREIESEFGIQIVNDDKNEDKSSDSSGCNFSESGFMLLSLGIFLFRRR